LSVSWSRRTATARYGTRTASEYSSEMKKNTSEISPRTLNATPMMTFASTNHQNSGRAARPSNFAYRSKTTRL
jgi:hypothetical protein